MSAEFHKRGIHQHDASRRRRHRYVQVSKTTQPIIFSNFSFNADLRQTQGNREREREKKSCMSFLTNLYRKLCKLYSIDKELGNFRVPLMSWHNKIIWWRQHKSSTMLHLFNKFEVVEFHFFSPSVYAKHLYTEYLTCENHLDSFKQGTENIRWPVERKKLVIHGFDWVRTGK